MSSANRRTTRSSNNLPSVPSANLRSAKTVPQATLPGKQTQNGAKAPNPSTNKASKPSTNMETSASAACNNDLPRPNDESTVMGQLKLDIAGLSPDLMKLAQAIVKAVLTISDAKLEAERKRHELELEGLRQEIQELSDEKDDMENYGRRNTIVISGPSITPAVTHEDTYATVMDIVNSKLEFQLSRQDIDVCHRLPAPKGSDPNRQADPTKKPIIVKFVRREVKHQILRASRNKKPSNIYFNESLSSTRQKIMYVIRKVKADNDSIISSYKTEDCNIRVYSPTAGSSGEPRRFIMYTLNTRRELDEFLLTKLGFRSTRYLEDRHWTKRKFFRPAPSDGASGARI